MSNAVRPKLACKNCSKRKIRCDKIVPCTPCTKYRRSCEREEDRTSVPEVVTIATAIHDEGDNSALARRVASLENQLTTLTTVLERLVPQTPSTPSADVNTGADPNLITHLETTSQVSQDLASAATVIEFLAWGRRKNVAEPENFTAHLHQPGAQSYTPPQTQQFQQLGSLLPEKNMVERIVRYHGECLLWYDGGVYLPTFKIEVERFFQEQSDYQSRLARNPAWSALLFAVLSSSLACGSQRAQQMLWNLSPEESSMMAEEMFECSLTCLDLADYMSKPHLNAVQCIATLTLPAHLLGFSSKHSVLLATAIKLAQSLGMHQLGREKAEFGPAVVWRETCRRAWCQLATQDFFQIPFSDTNAVNLSLTTTDKPRNCLDNDLEPQPESVPTLTSFVRFKYDIAKLLPQLQVALATAETPYTQYQHVLHFDAEMRELVTTGRPPFFGSEPMKINWPKWIPWARRALRISCAHKIIMIHRSFISVSFTNDAFAFTRKTCLAASRTILKCQTDLVDLEAPILWIEHAFVVTACVSRALLR